MAFLSQLIKKPIFLGDEKFATVIDFGLPENLASPFIATVLLKRGKEKFALNVTDISYENGRFLLKTEDPTSIQYKSKDFYLAEDLLDKQVIDITGKRMVRVNDVQLKKNGELKVVGIDIGFAGILRRLGLGSLNPLKTVSIPWSAVEAFDYETGDVRIKLGKSNLDTLHPAELADILEEAGTKHREGIVEVLSNERAAEAIEEANNETQEAILEQLPLPQLKKILEKMPLSEVADIADNVNPQTFKRIVKLLGTEKAKRVEKLMLFPDDTAGGLMDVSFYKVLEDKTIAEVFGELSKMQEQPETIIVVDRNDTLIGQVQANEFINVSPNLEIKQLVTQAFFTNEHERFSSIFRTFTQYNLRALPVIDDTNKIIGVISIDTVMRRIEEEEERDDTL